jgi:hypothetical protein
MYNKGTELSFIIFVRYNWETANRMGDDLNAKNSASWNFIGYDADMQRLHFNPE